MSDNIELYSTINSTSAISALANDPEFPYLPPCMKCQPIIDNTSIRIHDLSIPIPIKLFEDEGYNFGVFDIKIRDEIPITPTHNHIFFTIDASGSMSDVCSDGRTKMTHIHHTLENMLRIFYENKDCNISVYVQSFDTVVKPIIYDISNIHMSDLDMLVSSIHKIRPCGSTNIELALKKASEEINKYKSKNPEHQIVHIFLTDGDITEGSSIYNELFELVPQNCSNIFIGYGLDHDSTLLSHLSSTKGNEYRFIDALEKAGLVYGEVIHGILYKAIEDVTLTILNGEIYDYLTNTWNSELNIGNLLSDQTKTFHLRSKNMSEICILAYGKTIIKTRQFQTINIYEEQIHYQPIQGFSMFNLDVYIFRQRTQELLYEAKKIAENFKKEKLNIISLASDDNNYFSENKICNNNDTIKKKLKEFQKIMIDYMSNNKLDKNPIMKMLCDDIYIAYKTAGTSLGNMYTAARQTSNGRQQTYMCSAGLTENTENVFQNSPSNRRINRPINRLRLQRQTNSPSNVFFSDNTQINTFEPDYNQELDEIESYIPSQDFLSPFSSDGIVSLMREVSGNRTIGLTINTMTNYDDDNDNIEKTVKIN